MSSLLSFTIEKLAELSEKSEKDIFSEMLKKFFEERFEKSLISITAVQEIKRLIIKYNVQQF